MLTQSVTKRFLYYCPTTNFSYESRLHSRMVHTDPRKRGETDLLSIESSTHRPVLAGLESDMEKNVSLREFVFVSADDLENMQNRVERLSTAGLALEAKYSRCLPSVGGVPENSRRRGTRRHTGLRHILQSHKEK